MLSERLREPVLAHMDHVDVRTTMISTHVLNRGGYGIRTPLDSG